MIYNWRVEQLMNYVQLAKSVYDDSDDVIFRADEIIFLNLGATEIFRIELNISEIFRIKLNISSLLNTQEPFYSL